MIHCEAVFADQQQLAQPSTDRRPNLSEFAMFASAPWSGEVDDRVLFLDERNSDGIFHDIS